MTGKEERIGDDAFWNRLRTENKLFDKAKNHSYGAINLIKRLWATVNRSEESYVGSYLSSRDGLNLKERAVRDTMRTISVPEIALKNLDLEKSTEEKKVYTECNGYVTVLAFDGDSMGKVFGAHSGSPEQLCEVSGRLSRFALGDEKQIGNEKNESVRTIVERYDGYLIYAGGDDVLAILPSTQALECAKAIEQSYVNAFTGIVDGEGKPVHGSCGLAVGHKNAPLQMLVKSAHKVLTDTAKEKYERDAIAIILYKRSGEIIEWGTHWNSPGIRLLEKTTQAAGNGLSARFPYALSAVLKPYELQRYEKEETRAQCIPEDQMKAIIEKEVAHVLSRQGKLLSNQNDFLDLCKEYLGDLKFHFSDFVNLFLVETFLDRAREEM